MHSLWMAWSACVPHSTAAKTRSILLFLLREGRIPVLRAGVCVSTSLAVFKLDLQSHSVGAELAWLEG